MNRVSGRVVAALVVLGVVLAIAPAFYAGLVICGVSGCSGGGFGRATDPGLTRAALVVTGVVAALPLAIYALARRSRGVAVCALALAVVATLLTGLVIGSDLRGCPRDVSYETCLEEAG
jgi:formate-dependent nitrite reductase membrane component NrfD